MGFDQKRWQAERGNATGKNARSAMVADLDDAGIMVGAPRATVASVLGPPDGTGPDGDTYFLGRGAYAPDFETLSIRYGADDRITAIQRNQS